MKSLLITGGAGFIGSHVIRRFVTRYPDYQIINLDKLTYAGNLENLRDIEKAPNYTFIKDDILDVPFLQRLFRENSFDGVIHLAAESHVDRSLENPADFALTNVVGTLNLLHTARAAWTAQILKTLQIACLSRRQLRGCGSSVVAWSSLKRHLRPAMADDAQPTV